MPDTTSTPESEDRAFVIISNNEVKTASPTFGELLDEVAEKWGIVRLPIEGNLVFAKRINERKLCLVKKS